MIHRVSTVWIWLFFGGLLLVGCGGGKSAAQWKEEGMVRFQSGDYAAAAEAYRNAVSEDPDDAVAWNLLGMAYRFEFNETGNPDFRNREIDAFRRAVKLAPQMVMALKNLTASLYYSGDRVGAAEVAKQVLNLNPEDPEKETLTRWIREADIEVAREREMADEGLI